MIDESVVKLWKYLVIGVVILVISILLDDVYEKKKAFEAGLCQEMAVGSQTWKWLKCK